MSGTVLEHPLVREYLRALDAACTKTEIITPVEAFALQGPSRVKCGS